MNPATRPVRICGNTTGIRVLSLILCGFPFWVVLGYFISKPDKSLLETGICMLMMTGFLVLDLWIVLGANAVFYHPDNDTISLRRLGKTVVTIGTADFHVNYINAHAMAYGYFFYMVVRGHKYRYRSRPISLSPFSNFDGKSLAKSAEKLLRNTIRNFCKTEAIAP